MQKQFDTHEKSGASVGISDSLKVTQKKKIRQSFTHSEIFWSCANKLDPAYDKSENLFDSFKINDNYVKKIYPEDKENTYENFSPEARTYVSI